MNVNLHDNPNQYAQILVAAVPETGDNLQHRLAGDDAVDGGDDANQQLADCNHLRDDVRHRDADDDHLDETPAAGDHLQDGGEQRALAGDDVAG